MQRPSPTPLHSVMLEAMSGPLPKRAAVIISVVLFGFGLSGCTKCGWLWDQPARACHSDTPR
jgi:hypothetical protein